VFGWLQIDAQLHCSILVFVGNLRAVQQIDFNRLSESYPQLGKNFGLDKQRVAAV